MVLHFQGYIGSGGSPVDGPGQFKFALVGADDTISWSNAPVPEGADQPPDSDFVAVNVDHGFYAVRLGDSTLGNMAPLTLEALQVEGLKLRIWFNDGQQGFELLSPDQPI